MSDNNWLQTVRQQWLKHEGASSDFLHYLIGHQEVPGHIPQEPRVVDFGKHYVTLSWEKPYNCGGAPILAYKVERCEIGENGNEKIIEVGVTPSTCIDIYTLKPGGKYNFSVTPRNQYGWGKTVTTSTPTEIKEIIEYPEFEKHLPKDLKVLANTDIDLECQLKHKRNIEIQWLKDGIPIKDSKKYEFHYWDGKCCLKIKDLDELDSARYVCEAFNECGKVDTFVTIMVVDDKRVVDANTRLNRLKHENGKVDAAPQFTMRLRNRRVQMCYPVRLTCQVSGFPKPVISWWKDGRSIEENQYFSIINEAEGFHSLEINNTKPLEHSGIYSATAINSSGSISCKCELVVDKGLRTYVGPKFVDKLKDMYSVRENTILRLRAFVVAYPTVGITWQQNGIHLRPNRRMITTISHEGEVELTIAHIKQGDSGIYTCTATNDAGKAETNTRIEVYPAQEDLSLEREEEPVPEEWYSKEPKFIIKPSSCEALEGDHVIIKSKITGDPKPEVFWLRNRMKLDYYRDSDEFLINNEEVAPFEYTLEIPRVKFDHTGAYTVTAKNQHGEIKAIVSLQVFSRDPRKSETENKEDELIYSNAQQFPQFQCPLLDIRCCDGDSVTFTCQLNNEDTNVNFLWYKNGKIIPMESEFRIHSMGRTASLVIEQVYSEDEGEYCCVASNALGSTKTTAFLIVNVPEERDVIRTQLEKPNHLQSKSHTEFTEYLITPLRKHRDPTSRRSRTPEPKSSPKFLTSPQSKVVEEGEAVRFRCTTTGYPIPTANWYKYNVPVTSNDRFVIRKESKQEELEINNVNMNDEGLYRIVIENEIGRSEATARLDIINHRRK